MSSRIVTEVLGEDNYQNWRKCVRSYLEARGLWDIVKRTTGPPNRKDAKEEYENWRRKNAAALHAIQISCSPPVLSKLGEIKSANEAWNELAKMHGELEKDTETETEDDEEDEYAKFQPLVQAIYGGDLNGVKDFITQNPDAKLARINCHGDAAIHIATETGQDEIAKELVQLMSPQELEIKDNSGDTALDRAAVCGNVNVAKCIISKNNSMLSIGDEDGAIPVINACAEGQTKMARYLYSVTPIELLNGRLGASLISTAIRVKLFVIGQIPGISSTLLKFLGAKELYDMKLNQFYAIKILKFMCQNLPTSCNSRVSEAFFEAVKSGIDEFVVELGKANPQILDDRDENGRNFLFLATRLRHENIFNLIYGLDKRKNSITYGVDDFENCPLHLAGMLAPPSQIAHISGAALKMQREIQWYKEVESLDDPSSQFYENDDEETPNEVFIREHKALMEKGEAWMKENASSCSIVAGLIVTIMFAAAFTVPGGNDQITGYPIFLHKTPFKVFAIADAVSLFASTSSVLMFLGILTSRYRVEDFLKSLPTKLIIGLSTLFISIAAMVVAFCAALIIMFKGQLNIIIPIVVLATFPIGIFVWLQSPLLIEIFMSTYGPSIFNRKMKPWL